ncbi:MAG: NAD(P)-dependent oxidoreductase [Actinomycetia bacterium]|nr:NAD(P)-dependent oxidoreductase [Actinomycetes bacterium]
MRQVGWIGLGAMGLPMVQALLDAGWSVSVYDVNPRAVEAAAASGARPAADPADAARDAEALGIMVQDFDQTEEVLFRRGAAAALPDGAVLALFNTIGPDNARRVAERVGGRLAVLDAPVSGGVKRARGHLSIMVGAPETTVAKARELLDLLADEVEIIGPQVGDGQAMKTVNQLLAGVHIAAAAEALAFAARAGVDPRRAFEVISHSAGYSWMFGDRGPRMLDRDFEPPRSMLQIFVKDLGIVLDTARAAGIPLFLAPQAYQLFAAGKAQGLGRLDDSAMIAVYERLMTPGSDR